MGDHLLLRRPGHPGDRGLEGVVSSNLTKDEEFAMVTSLLERTRKQCCLRCGAPPDPDAPGCMHHDWSWVHGYVDPPEWWSDEGDAA